MLHLVRVPWDQSDWERGGEPTDRVLFQTREWLAFLRATQRAEPVVATVLRGDEQVGIFTGAVVSRVGLRILGSPFPGWTTPSMGFSLLPGVSRREAAEALVTFAFRALHCVHLELRDRRIEDPSVVAGTGFDVTPTVLLEVDLTADEEVILGRMTSACRRALRRGEKTGVTVEEAHGVTFADEYHAQLVEVFARQGLRPTYGVERVRQLIRLLEPTGHLLLLRARDPEGRPIASGIFPAMNGTGYFWGGASVRASQILRPNEAVFWYAMRYWKARAVTRLDLGGGGDYKHKYGPVERSIPHLRRSRFRALGVLRDVGQQVVARRQVIRAGAFGRHA